MVMDSRARMREARIVQTLLIRAEADAEVAVARQYVGQLLLRIYIQDVHLLLIRAALPYAVRQHLAIAGDIVDRY